MNIVTEINEWRVIRKQIANKSIGFVHTMGNLHAGHMNLCKQAKLENEVSVAAIFINPTQFNDAKDFELYPRTLEQDKKLLEECGMDFLLIFTEEELYPHQYQLQINETVLSKELEGEFRPGHFDGMLTIVLKYLNLVQPSKSYYGEKDYQQLLLIKKMAEDLFLNLEIVGCQTVRAEDDLALSSRNSRLSEEQRARASLFPKLLKSVLSAEHIKIELENLGFKVDYITDRWQRRLGAVWIEEIRLIDNIKLENENVTVS